MIHSINFISPGPIALSWRPSAGVPFSLSFLFIPVWFRTSRCCCSWTHYTAFQTGALNSWRDSTWSCSHALLCLGSLPAPLSSSTRSHRHKLKHRDTHCMTDWKLRNNFVKASRNASSHSFRAYLDSSAGKATLLHYCLFLPKPGRTISLQTTVL